MCPYFSMKMNTIMTQRELITQTLSQWLQPERFRDYAPNGLQVEGCENLDHLVVGVTACKALIEAAIDLKAQGVLVHHGLFWRGQDGRVVGWMRQRLGLLLTHNLNVWAYHLPLDAHADWGNNAQLGQLLALEPLGRVGQQDLVWWGKPLRADCQTPVGLSHWVTQQLGRSPVMVCDDLNKPIRKVAWCTGGAQSSFEAAIDAGADVYITGEISEPQAHLAREMGVAYLACGHHATERGGVQALGRALQSTLGMTCTFVDIPNPA
jgi:dinuclear metal center YbgI/SA1388 family protein